MSCGLPARASHTLLLSYLFIISPSAIRLHHDTDTLTELTPLTSSWGNHVSSLLLRQVQSRRRFRLVIRNYSSPTRPPLFHSVTRRHLASSARLRNRFCTREAACVDYPRALRTSGALGRLDVALGDLRLGYRDMRPDELREIS